MKHLTLITLFILALKTTWAQQLPSAQGKHLLMPYSTMALSAQYVGTAAADPDWYLWCFSPLEGKDGKIHAMVARWPKSYGMEGWSERDAEIAHYVADRPEGPFHYVNTVLTSTMFPDPSTMMAPHNPRLEYVDGKYVLLYICQDPRTPDCSNMRIGMMVADDINGPWHFAGNNQGIMVEASQDPGHWTFRSALGTDNPAFLKINGKYYIYFKSGMPEQLKARYGYAVSDNLEGPYVKCDRPITDNIGYIEDAQAFNVGKKYYLLTTDNMGKNTGDFGALILWESTDGLQFKRADAKIGMGTIFDYCGIDKEQVLGTPGVFVRSESGKLERPAVLKIKGKPAYLYGVAGVNVRGGSVSETSVFKIKWK